jgi:hypothetical protein
MPNRAAASRDSVSGKLPALASNGSAGGGAADESKGGFGSLSIGSPGCLRFGGWTLFVSELPQQLQRQCWLGQDADRFGSPDIGWLQVTLQPQNFCDPVEGGH